MKCLSYIRHILCVLIMLLTAHSASLAQLRKNSAYLDYIDRYKDIAIEQMEKHRIPASITLAQGLLESGAGRGTLAIQGNNHFGIKCHDWTGDRMYKDDDQKNDCFRVYKNALESYEDHSQFLKKSRYQSLFSLDLTDYKGWAKGLKRCGYATNPQYAQSLINIIETYQLYKYDHAKSYDSFLAKHMGMPASGLPHSVQFNNHNYYVVARKGDTFRTIGREFDISYRKLASYNERDKHETLSDGDIVYLEKKRTKADKIYKKRPHIVHAGESLYDIAQMYGIRLKSLYKKNALTPDYSPKVGDELRVY